MLILKMSPTCYLQRNFFISMYWKNFILLQCSSLFLMGMRKTLQSLPFFFFFQIHHKYSYQLMAPTASAPDQQISVAVSFWTHVSICSETSAPWRVKGQSLIFCLSSFFWQGWKWWLPNSLCVESQVNPGFLVRKLYHWLKGHEFEQPLGDRGQGSLVCCTPWGRNESDMT